jgi:hypothetical protein
MGMERSGRTAEERLIAETAAEVFGEIRTKHERTAYTSYLERMTTGLAESARHDRDFPDVTRLHNEDVVFPQVNTWPARMPLTGHKERPALKVDLTVFDVQRLDVTDPVVDKDVPRRADVSVGQLIKTL